jgi:hypothetical protein
MNAVKMMRAMLEIDADNGWWGSMPDSVKEDVEVALIEAEKGEVIPHAEILKRYKKWLAKVIV